jgi:AraC family transcriptional regulator
MQSDIVTLPPGRYLGRSLNRHDGDGFSVTQSAYAERDRLPEHSHSRAHFCLVVEGRYSEDVEGRRHQRRPGDLVFYPPDTAHAETHHTRGRHLLVEIEPALLERLAEVGEVPAAAQSCPPAARGVAGRLLAEAERPDALSGLAVEGLVLELLAQAARQDAAGRTGRPAWLDSVVRRIERRMPSPPRLQELAAEAGVHPTHLARALRRFRGESYGELVRRLRCEAARQALLESDMPLSEVALAAGFCDQSHFTRSFRRSTGQTPGVFRRLHRRLGGRAGADERLSG